MVLHNAAAARGGVSEATKYIARCTWRLWLVNTRLRMVDDVSRLGEQYWLDSHLLDGSFDYHHCDMDSSASA